MKFKLSGILGNKKSPHPWTGTRACSRYHPDYGRKNGRPSLNDALTQLLRQVLPALRNSLLLSFTGNSLSLGIPLWTMVYNILVPSTFFELLIYSRIIYSCNPFVKRLGKIYVGRSLFLSRMIWSLALISAALSTTSTGTAKISPRMPPTSSPASSANMIIKGCICRLLPTISGDRMLPSRN